MLINFFFALKKARIPVSITELLHLLDVDIVSQIIAAEVARHLPVLVQSSLQLLELGEFGASRLQGQTSSTLVHATVFARARDLYRHL